MKRLLTVALLACALLVGSQGTARANGGFSFGMGWSTNWSSYNTKQKSCGNGGCLPPPCWSGSYPDPALFSAYGGFPAYNPYACNYGAFNYGYPAQAWPNPNQTQPPPKAKPAPGPLPTDSKDK